MAVDRRNGMLALGLRGRACRRAPRRQRLRDGYPFSTFGLVPGGGAIDQTATLQEAADAAAQSGIPLFLSAAILPALAPRLSPISPSIRTSRAGAPRRYLPNGRYSRIMGGGPPT
jgi:hypothetical protein